MLAEEKVRILSRSRIEELRTERFPALDGGPQLCARLDVLPARFRDFASTFGPNRLVPALIPRFLVLVDFDGDPNSAPNSDVSLGGVLLADDEKRKLETAPKTLLLDPMPLAIFFRFVDGRPLSLPFGVALLDLSTRGRGGSRSPRPGD